MLAHLPIILVINAPTAASYQFYANVLSEDARYQWDKIVASQVDIAPWTNVRGKEHPTARVKSYLSFMDCVMLHLQTVFAEDAVEQEWYYILVTFSRSYSAYW